MIVGGNGSCCALLLPKKEKKIQEKQPKTNGTSKIFLAPYSWSGLAGSKGAQASQGWTPSSRPPSCASLVVGQGRQRGVAGIEPWAMCMGAI
jgi:hypothetical protein